MFVEVEAGCTPSCGKLNNIYYPFRLRHDPKHCGKADYELSCEDGKAFFYSGWHEYLVTEIQNPSPRSNILFGNITLLVNCPFTRSTCRLPYYSTSNFIYKSSFMSYSWASFMNCSQKIENLKGAEFYYSYNYMPVPSLSGENTTNYVAVGRGANGISALRQSCQFFDAFLFADDYSQTNSSTQVFETLQKGLKLSWFRGYSEDNCWTYALRAANGIRYEYSYSFQVLVLHRFDIVYNFFSCLSAKVCPLSNDDNNENRCQIIFEYTTTILANVLVAASDFAILCRFVLPPLAVCVYLIYNYWENTKPLDSIEKFLQKQQILLPRRFTYGEITIMTKHFKEKLGKGGFGHVYKGELFGGRLVAVKVLDGLHFNGEDFINEVSTIGMIHHVNIVQLIGFCSEGTKRALIYEYMPHGSLDKYIFSSQGNSTSFSLTLEKLHSIALDIAKGINYLHTGCDAQILHFDIKPHNILLDYNFVPKISDFGLAKLYPKEQNLVSISAARGTIGYIAPELISRSFGVISHKSDVYSFGMLILEMAGRRRNFDSRIQDSKEVYYPSWIYDQLTKLEASTNDEIREIGELEKKLCKVGLWCIQMSSSNRPTMSEVIKFLSSDIDDIKMPPEPFFLSTNATTEASTNVHSSSSALPVVIEYDDLSVVSNLA